MKKNYLNHFLLFLGMIIFLVTNGQAQSFDHEEYPQLDFDFTSLTLDLGLQPQNLNIDGAATYALTANIAGADTVILYASRLDISSVSLNDSTADYSLKNDSLFIPLDEPAEYNQNYKIRVRYSGNPHFGLLKDAAGTIWTSQLPRTQRHWLPIVDNPNVSMKTTFNISVPSDFEVWATGHKTGEDSVSADVKTYHFESNKKVPASSLGLAVGNFVNKSFTSVKAGKKINLMVENQLAADLNGQKLLQAAGNMMSRVEGKLDMDYPFDHLDILVLDDHEWETKTWGAATVYLYKNGGNLQQQLLRGIIAQWVGIYQRESQWKQADAINIYQALLYKQIAETLVKFKKEEVPDNPSATVYSEFGTEKWNEWLSALNHWEDMPIGPIINGSEQGFTKELPSVIAWRDLAGYWYRRSGQPSFFNGIDLPMTPDDTVSVASASDSVNYKVTYTLDETNGKLKLRFLANNQAYDSLITVEATAVYPDKTEDNEVTFSGNDASAEFNVSPFINTVHLKAPDHPELYFDEFKPASFLIYELRNGKTTKQRAEAARKLGVHSDNPDLQLAISDFMSSETNPKVKAALLGSMAKITDGAAGTEQTFLDALKSNSRIVRETALKALRGYKDNATITDRVQQIAINAKKLETFVDGTEIVAANASAETFDEYANKVIRQDTVGLRSIMVLQLLAEKGNGEEAVTKAKPFLNDNYRYEIRQRALHMLAQYDESETDWLTWTKALMTESDPRIRFLTVNALQKHVNNEITDFLETYVQDEYDARVHKEINQLLK